MEFIDVMANQTESGGMARTFHYVIAVVIGLPLIYILSVGPAIVIVVKVPKLREPVHTVYAPMIWLHDHTSLKQTMDPYLAFWETTARRL